MLWWIDGKKIVYGYKKERMNIPMIKIYCDECKLV